MARSPLQLVIALALASLVATSSGPARADVTVFFGTPAPCSGGAPARAGPESVDESGESGSRVIPGEAGSGAHASEATAPSSESTEGSPGSIVIPAASSDPAPATAASETVPPAAVDDGAATTASSPAVPARAEPTSSPAVGERAAEPASHPSTPEPSCAPVEIVRVGDGSNERASLVLVDCDGNPDSTSLLELSLLARPHGEDRPSDAALAAHQNDAGWIAPRVRRLEVGLLARLRAIADRFPGQPIEIVSGYRPGARAGSRHRLGRALDLRVRGVDVATLDAFARTLEATGVGLYPTTEFIHVDVRARSAHWIDTSGPGEPPSLVREPAPEAAPASPASATERSAPLGEPGGARGEDEPSEPVDPAAIGREAAALLDGFALDLRP